MWLVCGFQISKVEPAAGGALPVVLKGALDLKAGGWCLKVCSSHESSQKEQGDKGPAEAMQSGVLILAHCLGDPLSLFHNLL